MSTFTFKDVLNQLSTDLKALALKEYSEHKAAFLKDGRAFARDTKDDLLCWTQQAAAGELSAEDLEFLIKGKMDCAELNALKQRGLARARLQRIRESLVSAVVGSVLKVALP
jgi:hypothetical protein